MGEPVRAAIHLAVGDPFVAEHVCELVAAGCGVAPQDVAEQQHGVGLALLGDGGNIAVTKRFAQIRSALAIVATPSDDAEP